MRRGPVLVDLTRTSARTYADEAALVNTFRRLKRSLLNMPKKLGLIYEKPRSVSTIVPERR